MLRFSTLILHHPPFLPSRLNARLVEIVRSEAGVPISTWALSREKLAKFLFSVRRSLLRTERLANK